MNRQPKALKRNKKKSPPPTSAGGKIYTINSLRKWRAAWKKAGVKVGLTNGCFDLLHRGHVTYLEKARRSCDKLIVAVNSDQSVRALGKGAGRPLNGQRDRAYVLGGLGCVDAVLIFNDPTVTRIIQDLCPDIYFKGGDYTLDTLNADEKKAVLSGGGKIQLIPLVPGRSTTKIVKKMQSPQKK